MKLDRLLSRIRAALQGYATEFEQRALAAEYADCCAKAAERLEQVVPLIRQGQDFSALQIAESPPPVLDLVRQLAFAEAEQWRAFCQKNGLPTARPFDERAVDLVNKLYGKKIGETHPLYREYRQAIRTRKEDAALGVLQSIRRVNPDDANAHAEFARLAHKLQDKHRAELASALALKDTPHALALMELIENIGLPENEQDAAWQEAKKFRDQYHTQAAQVRCGELIPLLQQARQSNDWKNALPLLAEWDTLRNQYEFKLPDADESAAAAVREWAAAFLAEQEQIEEHQRRWRELDDFANKLAREDPYKKPAKTLAEESAEVRALLAQLAAEPSTNGTGAPPANLQARLQEQAGRLRAELRRRQWKKAGLAAVAVAAVVVVVGLIMAAHARSQQRQADLDAISQHFKDGATKQLAAALVEYDAHFHNPEADPAMVDLLAQARQFVNTHQAVVDRFDKELAQITDSANANPSPSQIHSLFAGLDQLNQETGGLGAEDAQEAKATVQNLRVRLNQRLAHQQDTRAASLADIAQRASQLVDDKLSTPLTAAAAQPIIASAKKILTEADNYPPDPSATSPAEDTARAEVATLTAKVDAMAAAARDAVAASAQLALAHSLEDYHSAMAALAKDTLTIDPSVAAAHAIFAKNGDWADAAQRILLPDDAAAWAFLANTTQPTLFPAEHNQQEDIALANLLKNETLGQTYHADLVTYADGVETARTPIALVGLPTEKHNKLDNLDEIVQDGQKINADGTTSPISTDWMEFTGQKAKGQQLEKIALSLESKLFEQYVRPAYSRDRDMIVQPLLRVLDDIRSDHTVSPVFVAYLEQELFQIMQTRPDDWGLAFSSKATSAEHELAKSGHLQPTDWIFTAPNTRLYTNLQAFILRTASDNYYDDATAHLQTLIKKRSTPVRFAGYVDLDGAPHSTAPAGSALWGLDNTGNWVALYRVDSGAAPTPVPGAQPARLTPLVYPQENSGGQ